MPKIKMGKYVAYTDECAHIHTYAVSYRDDEIDETDENHNS